MLYIAINNASLNTCTAWRVDSLACHMHSQRVCSGCVFLFIFNVYILTDVAHELALYPVKVVTKALIEYYSIYYSLFSYPLI